MPRQGYSSLSDADIYRTSDGVSLSDLWTEFQEVVRLNNDHRDSLTSLLAYESPEVVTRIDQSAGGTMPERRTEFGIPTASRVSPNIVESAYPLDWYDNRLARTWAYMQVASAEQLRAELNAMLEGFNKLRYWHILDALFTSGVSSIVDPVGNAIGTRYPLWNGVNGEPPVYMGKTFGAGHSHFLTNATLTSAKLAELIDTVAEHGALDRGARIIVLVNPAQLGTIAAFRVADSDAYDFIPSVGAAPWFSDVQLFGDQPPASFEGLPVAGSFKNALIVEHNLVPSDNVVAVASQGANSAFNPVHVRVPEQANLRGVIQIPGNNNAYPLIDSFATQGLGAGIRHRSNAAVLQLTGGSYAKPTITV